MKVTKMSRAIMPSMINTHGIMFGGILLQWMDEVSGIEVMRFLDGMAITAAVERVDFKHPIPEGAFVDVEARVLSVGNTSMRVRVTVTIDAPECDILAAEAVFVYVALDEQRRPKKITRVPESLDGALDIP